MIHSNSNDLHFRQVTTLLRRRWLLILIIMILGGTAAAVLGFNTPPRYTAKAQLLYQTEVEEGVEKTDEAAVDTLVELLISPSHLRRLAVSMEENPVVRAQDPGTGQTPTPADGAETVPLPVLDYAALDEGLNVYKERQSNLVAITFTSTDPETSAVVANRAVELYLDFDAALQRERRDYALKLVDNRIPGALAKIDEVEGALREHRIKHGLHDAAGADMIEQQIGDLTRQHLVARSDLAARNAKLEALALQRPAKAEGSDDDAISPLNIAAQAGERAGDRVGDAPPARSAPPADIKRLALDRDALAARVGDIESRLAALQNASTETTSAWIRLRELEREASAAGTAYEKLLSRKADIQARGISAPPARLVTVAAVPTAPSSANPWLFVAPAVVASMLVGGMLAILFERLDQRLRSERDVEMTLAAPCIGLVPRLARRKRSRLLQFLRDNPFAPYTEAIRSVFVAASRQSERTILVTSGDRGEGKTTLLLSLALFAKLLGRRVLVIDFDLRNPTLEKILAKQAPRPRNGTREEPRPEGWEIRSADHLGIHYLSLPHLAMDPLALLSDEGGFARQLRNLRETYDCILIDSAPVAGATETRLLASMVDHVLFTVRWGQTEAGEAVAAVQQLRAARGQKVVPISVVVNRVKLAAHQRRYSERVPMSVAEA